MYGSIHLPLRFLCAHSHTGNLSYRVTEEEIVEFLGLPGDTVVELKMDTETGRQGTLETRPSLFTTRTIATRGLCHDGVDSLSCLSLGLFLSTFYASIHTSAFMRGKRRVWVNVLCFARVEARMQEKV